MSEERIIEFIRKKDYKLKQELGAGACGKTVLLYDETTDEYLVCKKYSPYLDRERDTLFKKFVQEIKLLYLIHHPNIVRVFNHYVYPEIPAGYILMEYVKGTDIEDYIKQHPENTSDIFVQAVQGFAYLERSNILHRDIRPLNIMITDEGILKIIDFGFGKQIFDTVDFDKSITLNWWCEPPLEFKKKIYNFKTEVYFLGKLFEKLISDNEIESFKYTGLLDRMCEPDPTKRIESFYEVAKQFSDNKLDSTEFSDDELSAYREFAGALHSVLGSIEESTKYYDDVEFIQKRLESAYKSVMLEEYIPDSSIILGCLLKGMYKYRGQNKIAVYQLRGFIELLRGCTKEKKNVVLNNICSRLDAIKRFSRQELPDDEIPF